MESHYTPYPVIPRLFDYVQQNVARVVDLGCGDGRLLKHAASVCPRAELMGVDNSSQAVKSATESLGTSAAIWNSDLLKWRIPPRRNAGDKTHFVMNPPYTRAASMDDWQKEWVAKMLESFELDIRSIPMYLAAVFKAALLGKSGDRATFIVPTNWLFANYGRALAYLTPILNIERLRVLSANAKVFAGAMTTSMIVDCGPMMPRTGHRNFVTLEWYDQGFEQANKASSSIVPIQSLYNNDLRRELAREVNKGLRTPLEFREDGSIQKRSKRPGTKTVGELFEVKRGLVTGCNKAFVIGKDTPEVPIDYTIPMITRARHLREWGSFGRVIVLPEELPNEDWVSRWIDFARNKNAHNSNAAKARGTYWYVLNPVKPPDVFVSYMYREGTAKAHVNTSGYSYLNVLNGLYCREPMTERSMQRASTIIEQALLDASWSRRYSDGLCKLEPVDLASVQIGL